MKRYDCLTSLAAPHENFYGGGGLGMGRLLAALCGVALTAKAKKSG